MALQNRFLFLRQWKQIEEVFDSDELKKRIHELLWKPLNVITLGQVKTDNIN